MPNAESGFSMVEVSVNSGYLGAFALKPPTPKLTMMGFAVGSYGSENGAGENDKGYFAGLCLGYLVQKRHSI